MVSSSLFAYQAVSARTLISILILLYSLYMLLSCNMSCFVLKRKCTYFTDARKYFITLQSKGKTRSQRILKVLHCFKQYKIDIDQWNRREQVFCRVTNMQHLQFVYSGTQQLSVTDLEKSIYWISIMF